MDTAADLDCFSPIREATFAFIDVETTGFVPGRDRVVEVACVIVRGGERRHTFSSLVDPERTIPATASAVHHLTGDDVANAPTLAQLVPQLRALTSQTVIVAHNAHFDLGFLPFLADRPLLCSLRFAQRMLPEAPNHKNQVLRYHLQVKDPLLGMAAAHRALGDAVVTSHVFARCLERYVARGGLDDVGALVASVMAPQTLTTLRFGRHRGVPVSDVPLDYLAWILETPPSRFSQDVRHTAALELRSRDMRTAPTEAQ